MAQDQWSHQNIVDVPLRDDEVSLRQQVQIIPQNIVDVSLHDNKVSLRQKVHKIRRSSRTTTFERGFLFFSKLNDQVFLRQVLMNFREQRLLAQAIRGPTFGLRLQKTEALAELIERRLGVANENKGQIIVQQDGQKKDKLKAVHFPIASLQIGQFMLTSLHEAHLVAKCYHAKRKLVWEILENGLKKKIEILWHGISNIQALLPENGPGILKIMLQDRPSFHREIGPTPMKHTIWKRSEDFTRGQASIIRKHLLVFEPGVLDKYYAKLLQCDENLHRLSLQPFPDLELPFFTSCQPSSSTPVPLLRPSTEQDQQFNPNNLTTSTLDISSETEVINNNKGLQDSKAVVSHGGYADSTPNDPNPDSRKQPFKFTHSPQKVHQLRDLITLPPSSFTINHSTSSAFDLLAKNSMLSAKQQQPSSSTAAPMPSTQQVQQFKCPVTLPSSLGINNSTLGISTAGTEVINNNQRPQESQQAVQHGGPPDEYANFATDNSLSLSGARDPELLDPIDQEMRDIETYLHSQIDLQTLRRKAAETNSSATTFAAPPMRLQDPATHANINDDKQTDDSFKEITYEDLFPSDDDADLQC